MNIELTMKGDLAGIAAERERNDRFRACPGAVWLSAGVVVLGADSQARIVEDVRSFAGFDDDPWDAHDIGDVEVTLSEPGIQRCRELVFFRVLAFERDPTEPRPSSAPVAPATERLLAIMLASEW